jgi:hypothetical protein
MALEFMSKLSICYSFDSGHIHLVRWPLYYNIIRVIFCRLYWYNAVSIGTYAASIGIHAASIGLCRLYWYNAASIGTYAASIGTYAASIGTEV